MIFCFSGTGNSLAVARELAVGLSDSIHIISGKATPMPDKRPSARIIWVFPTYSWGVPPVVVDSIKRLAPHLPVELPNYMVTTCGDDVGRCAAMWRHLLHRFHLQTGAAFSVQMPNTYVFMKGFDIDPQKTVDEKLSAMPARVKSIVNKIITGNAETADDDELVKGSFPWTKTTIIYPWFKRFEMNPRKFTSYKSTCSGCGLCASSCPLGNITMTDGNPSWGNDCAFCLRCYHICPSHAIDYAGTATNKGQYNLLIPKKKQ